MAETTNNLFPTFPEAEKRKIKVLAGLESGEGLCSGLQEAVFLCSQERGREGTSWHYSHAFTALTNTQHKELQGGKAPLAPTFRTIWVHH